MTADRDTPRTAEEIAEEFYRRYLRGPLGLQKEWILAVLTEAREGAERERDEARASEMGLLADVSIGAALLINERDDARREAASLRAERDALKATPGAADALPLGPGGLGAIEHLVFVATGEMAHRRKGRCPSAANPKARDYECSACHAIDTASAALAPSPRPTQPPTTNGEESPSQPEFMRMLDAYERASVRYDKDASEERYEALDRTRYALRDAWRDALDSLAALWSERDALAARLAVQAVNLKATIFRLDRAASGLLAMVSRQHHLPGDPTAWKSAIDNLRAALGSPGSAPVAPEGRETKVLACSVCHYATDLCIHLAAEQEKLRAAPEAPAPSGEPRTDDDLPTCKVCDGDGWRTGCNPCRGTGIEQPAPDAPATNNNSSKEG
jgi:hypothetical protein